VGVVSVFGSLGRELGRGERGREGRRKAGR